MDYTVTINPSIQVGPQQVPLAPCAFRSSASSMFKLKEKVFLTWKQYKDEVVSWLVAESFFLE